MLRYIYIKSYNTAVFYKGKRQEGMFVYVQTIKTYQGVEVWLHSSLTLTLDG
jgi:hypothetical protein